MPASVEHRVISFFHLRDRLVDAAEQAKKPDGTVDLTQVAPELRDGMVALAGATVKADVLRTKLDETLVTVDLFDVGPTGGRRVPATGGCGARRGDESTIAQFRENAGTGAPQAHSGVLGGLIDLVSGRRAALKAAPSNLVLDASERQKLVATGGPAANALLTLLDKQAASRAALRAKHFPGVDSLQATTVWDRSQPGEAPKNMSLTAPAGATKDLATISAKGADGTWKSANVNADGSFHLELGLLRAGESKPFEVSFTTKAGDKVNVGEISPMWRDGSAGMRELADEDSLLRA